MDGQSISVTWSADDLDGLRLLQCGRLDISHLGTHNIVPEGEVFTAGR